MTKHPQQYLPITPTEYGTLFAVSCTGHAVAVFPTYDLASAFAELLAQTLGKPATVSGIDCNPPTESARDWKFQK